MKAILPLKVPPEAPSPSEPPAFPLQLPSPARLLIIAGIALLSLLSLVTYSFVKPLVTAELGTPIPGTPGISGYLLPSSADSGILTIDEVATLSTQGAFVPMPTRKKDRDPTRETAGHRWHRIDFDTPGPNHKRVILDLIWRIYDTTTLYLPQADGSWHTIRDGEKVPPDDPYRSERWRAFEITLPPGQPTSIFIHTQDAHFLPNQFRYWENPTHFSDRERFIYLHYSAFFGLWFGILTYGFFLYAMLRQRDQLLFTLFIGLRGIAIFFSAYVTNLFFPIPSIPGRELLSIGACIGSLAALCHFTRHFLETPTRDPGFDRLLSWLLRFLIAWSGFILLSAWFAPFLLQSHTPIAGLFTLILLGGSLRSWRLGAPQAPFFACAFLPYLAGLGALYTISYNNAAQDDPGRFVFTIAVGLNMLLLSLAPAYRHRLDLNRNIRQHQGYTEQLEDEVARRTQVLQSFNEHLSSTIAERDRIITIIGHDLRAPAATLHSLVRILSHDAPNLDREGLTKLASQISHACVLQFELLNNLLIWGNTQNGKWKPHCNELSLLEAIATAWDYLDSVACDKSITLHTSIPPDLLISADTQLLQTVLRNLLANAIKFSHPESTIEVTCTPCPTSQSVEICVKDSGVGIAPEQLSKLFSSETQSTPGTREEHGSGIGLSLCRDLLKAVGGEIHIESVPNLGTHIRFILPDAFLQPPPAPSPHQESFPPKPHNSLPLSSEIRSTK